MTTISPLMPRQRVPVLQVPTLSGDTWRLADQHPKNFTLVVFYRGLHCGICSGYLGDLDRKLTAFEERGVGVVAISSDTQERAKQSQEKWQLPNLVIGYDLDLDVAHAWGLYISTGRGMTSSGVEEPKLFSEPGLFLVRADGTLYFASVQTMPFARPGFGDILKALDFVLAKDYPARGEVIDHKQAVAA
jgi:peroxiredoxin